MSAADLVLGASLGCAVVALLLLRRLPHPAQGGLPPHPTPAAEREALRRALAGEPEPQAALLDVPERMPAPLYAVRALQAEEPPAEEGPRPADRAFSRRMWAEECRGREVLQEDARKGDHHPRPRERRGAA